MTASGFAPHVLREYALLADGERGALVGPRGDIVWMCAPRWHSDAVFSELIGGRGVFAVTPVDRFVWGGYYEDGSLIWRSRWVTPTAIVECREALAFPGDPHRAVVLRRLTAVEGEARVRAVLEPAAAFGRSPLSELRRRHHCWEGRAGLLSVRAAGWGPRAAHAGPRLESTLTLAPGETHDLVVEIADHALDGPSPDPDQLWAASEAAWRRTVPELANSLAPVDARRAYAVLRGLTSAGGGMVAAATIGLPERARRGRDYDYRYVWIRDQCYAGQAVAADAAHPLLDDAVAFVAERLLADGPHLAPAYTVDGARVPDQRALDLPGYPGGTDIVGNHVNAQFQLDAFGEALLLFAAAARHDHLDTEHVKAVDVSVAAIEARHHESDAGIWELDDRRWTHSRLTCAAGLYTIAEHLPGPAAVRAIALADALVANTSAECLHPDGRWQRTPDDPRVDAALLLPALRGAVPTTDPRSTATLAAIAAELGEDGYLYRFRHDARPLGHAEGAFTLCGFWMALAAHQQGHRTAALRWFERNRAACGSPGLLSEEFDVTQHQLRGNLPQAFVHALLFEAAVRLAGPDTGWLPREVP
jgi:alpha,alpha-trehalase